MTMLRGILHHTLQNFDPLQDYLDLQCALIVLNAFEELTEVAFAKAATPPRLFQLFLPIKLRHCVLTAYPLNDL